MTVDVIIPELGESVSEGVITRWLKQDGDHVIADEPILELETDKATIEIPAAVSGRLQIVQAQGATVPVGQVVARIVEGAAPAGAGGGQGGEPDGEGGADEPGPSPAADPATAAGRPASRTAAGLPPPEAEAWSDGPAGAEKLSVPAPEGATAALPGPRVDRPQEPAAGAGAAAPAPAPPAPARPDVAATTVEVIERVPMTSLRRRIAERLVEAQRTAAILTTFNEVDCGELLAMRRRYRERFRATHGVDLGLMSLFGRACVLALRDVPVVNARIDGGDIVYQGHVHLGIAVATERGLVVPVIRHAHALSLAGLEQAIDGLAARAREGKLAPGDLAGGTFSITNGGVFGSLLSTPILNPPQSAILGMHRIQDRPVAADGQVVIRPMMYVALSYDHRLVDGQQAVTFLVRVKERLEDPGRLLLEL